MSGDDLVPCPTCGGAVSASRLPEEARAADVKSFRLVFAGCILTGDGRRPVALRGPQRGVEIWGENADDAVARFELALAAIVAAVAEEPEAVRGLLGTGHVRNPDPEVQIPPHANAEAHAVAMAKLRKMTSTEIAETARRAGICDADGKLTPQYGGEQPIDATHWECSCGSWHPNGKSHLDSQPL